MSDPSPSLRAALPVAAEILGRVGAAVGAARGEVDRAVLAMLGPDFEARIDALRSRGVDAFGLDPDWAKWAVACAAFFHRVWFRTEVFGIDRVPAGRVMLVANHGGQLPFDGMVIGAAMFLDAAEPRMVRTMVERWTQTLPFVSLAFSRLGQVNGVPANARRLLEAEECVLVFPEGVGGISKPFSQRYQLQPFGTGFLRLALATGTPVVPVGVIGAEEQYVSLGNARGLAALLGTPSLPLLPQVLIPGGVMPLPVRYRLHFGDPMRFEGDPDDDDTVLEHQVTLVKAAVEQLVARGLAQRASIFR